MPSAAPAPIGPARRHPRRHPLVRNRWSEWVATAPSMGWLLLGFALPTLLVFAIAFRPVNLADGGIGAGWTLATWHTLANPNYPAIIWRTLWISGLTALVCVLLGIPCAYAMARAPARWRGTLTGLVILPFWTSFIIRVFAWRFLLHPDGALQGLLVRLGLIAPNALLLYNSGAVLLVSVYTYLPFAILPLYAAAEKFDFCLLEAARDLGARPFRAFRSVFLPGIRRGIVTAVAMVFIPALGSYVIPDLVGGRDSEMIGNKIAQRTFSDRNLPHASALSALLTVATLTPLAIFALVRRRTEDRAAGPQTRRPYP